MITANFKERNFGSGAGSGDKSGPWAVSYKAGPVTCVRLGNQIRGFGHSARSDAGEKNKIGYVTTNSYFKPQYKPSGLLC